MSRNPAVLVQLDCTRTIILQCVNVTVIKVQTAQVWMKMSVN